MTRDIHDFYNHYRDIHDEGLRISRRRFLGSTALGAAALPAIALSDAPSSHAAGVTPGPAADAGAYLRAAISAAEWIDTARQEDDRGVYWLPEPDHPDKRTTVSAVNAIYSGSAGTVLFFLQLAAITGEPQHLQSARRGADYLAATWRDLVDQPGGGLLSGPGLNLSLYGGLSGLAFVLIETSKATGDDKYRGAAKAATDHIVAAATESGRGLQWSGAPGIAADGSVVLYLLYAADELHDASYRRVAQRAGDRLLELAVADPRGGLKWRGFPSFPGLPQDAYFPNFEGGTAGVAYVLARLHRVTGDAKYLDAAQQGAAHLRSIATIHKEAALIPYRFPDLTDVYYLGFCHGPAGTARTFHELHQITKDPIHREWTERLAQGVVQSGVPELQTPGYWNVVCQCCGSAALVDFFVGLWAASGRKDYLDYGRRVATQLVSRGTNLDGKGTRWYQAWTRVKPWEVSAETGYSIGAAGVGAALLHVHLAGQDKYRAILFPDNPFPNRRLA
jgi:hypothetical protein